MEKHYVNIDGISTGYPELINHLRLYGNRTSPRGKDTLEIAPLFIKVRNPADNLFMDTERNLNVGFALAEWLSIIGGRNSVEMLSYYNSNISSFSDDGETFHGAYGPRIAPNIIEVVKLLKSDRDSRQAVINVFDALRDLYVDRKDIPCTCSLQFLIRNDKLDLIVNMRSNDIDWGFPYDIFVFTSIQEQIAWELGISSGEYYHMAGSFHMYKESIEKLSKVRTGEYVHVQNPCPLNKVNELLEYEVFFRKKGIIQVLNMLEHPNLSSRARAFGYYRLLKDNKLDELDKFLHDRNKMTQYSPFFLRSIVRRKHKF